MAGFDSVAMAQNMTGGGAAASYSPTFGNVGFLILPSETGEVSNTFATIPYMAIEALFQMEGGGNIDPTRINSGMSQGNAVIQGQTSIQDGNGLTRMVMGYVPGGF